MSKNLACVDKKHALEVEHLVYPSSKHTRYNNPNCEDETAEHDSQTPKCSGCSASVGMFDMDTPKGLHIKSCKYYHDVSKGDIEIGKNLSSVDAPAAEKGNIGEAGINDNLMTPSTKIHREINSYDAEKSKSTCSPNPSSAKCILFCSSNRSSENDTVDSLELQQSTELIDKDEPTSSSGGFVTERDENLSKKQKCESTDTQDEKLEFADKSSMIYDDYYNEEIGFQFIPAESEESAVVEASKDEGPLGIREATIDKEFEQTGTGTIQHLMLFLHGSFLLSTSAIPTSG